MSSAARWIPTNEPNVRRKKSDTLYHTCLDPWQQERILAGDVNDICEVITEVIGNDGKNA